MKNWKRSIFFWVLALLCIATIPLVVLHATGYRFDTGRGVFVYSGTVTFKSNPQTVNVKLNGEETDAKKLNRINNSFNLTGLVPGSYDIEISSPDFQTWSKKTDVHSGLASEFWNVLLVRNNYEKTGHGAQGIKKFFISPKNRYLAYTADSDGNLSVNVTDIKADSSVAVFAFSGWNFINDNRRENIEWSPDGNLISIPVEKKASAELKNSLGQVKIAQDVNSTVVYNYFVVKPEDGSSFNLNEFLGQENIKDVRWDPNQENYLFFIDGQNVLRRANISDAADMTPIAENVSAYDLSSSGVYYVKTPNNLVFEKSLDGKSAATQMTSTFPSENENITRVIVYDNSRIAFITADASAYVFNRGDHDTYFKKLGDSVKGIHFSNDGKKLLFWSDYEISTYFLRDWQVSPVRSENETQNITRYSEPISNVQWFSDYEHVIFNSGRWIKIIELDPRDHRNCMDLAGASIDSTFVIYNSYLEKLYFTDEKDGTADLYSIDFPEKTSLLGITGLGG